MEKEFEQARRGKVFWDKLNETYQADKYIIMPHVDDEYNDYALEYFEAYMEKEKAKSAVFLATDSKVIKRINCYEGKYSIVLAEADEEKISDILRFYALYEFSTKVTIISLTRPYDTCGENLLGVHGVTKRELLCYDIYRFAEIPKNHKIWWDR